MKKLLFPLAIIAISFASCSDDDSMPTPVDPTPVDPTPTPAVELKLSSYLHKKYIYLK